jgi:hypothetical protein
MCVRVTGSLKTFGQKRYLNATHIRASRDPHEIYFHILESIAVTLMIDRGLVCYRELVMCFMSADQPVSPLVREQQERPHLKARTRLLIRPILTAPRSMINFLICLLFNSLLLGSYFNNRQVMKASM